MMYLHSILRSVILAAPLVNAVTLPNIPLNGMHLGWPSLFGQPIFVFSPTQYVIDAHDYFNPDAIDFWKEAGKLGDDLVRYTNEQLQSAAMEYTSVMEKINEFKATMEHLVAGTKEFADKMRKERINLDELSEKVAAELNTVLEELKAEFSEPLPEDKTSRQADREKVVLSALSKVEVAVIKVSALWGISEESSRAHLKEIEPHVKSMLLICGHVIDEHPILVETLLFMGATLLLPEASLLRPILSLFGFGPYGPVKGSTAAWAQRRFWGAAVKEGSWFSRMQAAGMKTLA